jgi:hypothetical protein
MKKGGAALAGPIWNAVMTAALKTLPVDSFVKPDPIDTSIPPILRGFWQGGDTFVVDTISNSIATEFTPPELQKETSITNVHTILYWMNKDNPLVKASGLTNDSQYNNWEYGVQKWWAANSYKYPIITDANKPTNTDIIHTAQSKPIFTISGIQSRVYKKDETITVSFNTTDQNPIKKVDVFVNNTYLTSLKTYPLITSFVPRDISDISAINTIHIIGVDVLGNIGEQTMSFSVGN